MAENSKIQWTHHTHNPWRGCRKVSDECANCYIVTTVPFRTTGQTHGPVRVRASKATLREPYKWNEFGICKKCGWSSPAGGGCGRPDPNTGWCEGELMRPRVFCLSLGDWLDDENVPAEWLADLLKTIHETPNLDWLLLTKRPQNFEERIAQASEFLHPEGNIASEWLTAMQPMYRDRAPSNVWIGVSVGADQSAALDIPAKIHFLSAEPMLRPLISTRLKEFDWCIFGGESGHNARPCNIEWIRDGVKQCRVAGVAPFVKQLGTYPVEPSAPSQNYPSPNRVSIVELNDKKGGDITEWPEDLRVREFPNQ